MMCESSDVYTGQAPGTWQRIISHMTIPCILYHHLGHNARMVLCNKITKFLSWPVIFWRSFTAWCINAKHPKSFRYKNGLCVETLYNQQRMWIWFFVGSLEIRDVMLFALDTFVESTRQRVSPSMSALPWNLDRGFWTCQYFWNSYYPPETTQLW